MVMEKEEKVRGRGIMYDLCNIVLGEVGEEGGGDPAITAIDPDSAGAGSVDA